MMDIRESGLDTNNLDFRTLVAMRANPEATEKLMVIWRTLSELRNRRLESTSPYDTVIKRLTKAVEVIYPDLEQVDIDAVLEAMYLDEVSNNEPE